MLGGGFELSQNREKVDFLTKPTFFITFSHNDSKSSTTFEFFHPKPAKKGRFADNFKKNPPIDFEAQKSWSQNQIKQNFPRVQKVVF